MTFWTGNHPLARGEGDLAANPELKKAELAFRRAHPGLSPEALEPLYYREAIGWIAAHPRRLDAARRAQGVLQRGSDRPVVCGTLRQIPCGVGRAVSARPAVRRRRRAAAVAEPTPAGIAAAPRGVVDSCRPRLFSTGAVPHARHRPRADRFRRRAGGLIEPSSIVTTASDRPRRRPDLQRARQPAACSRAACSRTRASACWSSTMDRRTAPARSPMRSPPSIRAGSRSCTARASAGSGARTSTACRRRSRSPTSISSARWTPTCRTIPSTCRRSSPPPPTTTSSSDRAT